MSNFSLININISFIQVIFNIMTTVVTKSLLICYLNNLLIFCIRDTLVYMKCSNMSDLYICYIYQSNHYYYIFQLLLLILITLLLLHFNHLYTHFCIFVSHYCVYNHIIIFYYCCVSDFSSVNTKYYFINSVTGDITQLLYQISSVHFR